MELPIALPLPLLHCWAVLLRTASRLGATAAARTAAPTLNGHFTLSTAPQPPWAQHPMDRLKPHTAHLRQASAPLLRSFALATLCHCERLLLPLPVAPAAGDRESRAAAQLQRLLAVKRLLIALQVCSFFLTTKGFDRKHTLTFQQVRSCGHFCMAMAC